jgi:hypothetical protein
MKRYLTHFVSIFLFVMAALLVPHSIMASTVGNCAPGGFPTISSAVAAATSGTIIKVCPGTYPEQVVISTALTLEGITSGNASRPVITVPGSGFPTTLTTIIGGTVTPQVLVTVPGVNISSITVDGAGASVSTRFFAGIFYESGSSGIVKEVTTRNQNAASGVGIWAENGNPTAELVTIENSSVHDVNAWGIVVVSNQVPPSLTATILKNDVLAAGNINIFNNAANASITSNVVTGAVEGISMAPNSVGSITGNTILNASHGIFDETTTSHSIKSNLILNSTNDGIFLSVAVAAKNATIESNTITKSPVGIEFDCSPGPDTVKSNNISDVTVGLDFVQLSITSVNTYNNVDTIRTGGCGFAPTTAPSSPLLP